MSTPQATEAARLALQVLYDHAPDPLLRGAVFCALHDARLAPRPSPDAAEARAGMSNSALADKARGVARCLTYNGNEYEAAAKHLLREMAHRLDGGGRKDVAAFPRPSVPTSANAPTGATTTPECTEPAEPATVPSSSSGTATGVIDSEPAQPAPAARAEAAAGAGAVALSDLYRVDCDPEGPYRIDCDDAGCEACSSGKTWAVVHPDGTPEGILSGHSYGDDDAEDAAQAEADALNAAWRLGHKTAALALASENERLKGQRKADEESLRIAAATVAKVNEDFRDQLVHSADKIKAEAERADREAGFVADLRADVADLRAENERLKREQRDEARLECEHIKPCCGNYDRCDSMCIHRAEHWKARAEAALAENAKLLGEMEWVKAVNAELLPYQARALAAEQRLCAVQGEPVAEVCGYAVSHVRWLGHPMAAIPPAGTKLYAHPAPSPEVEAVATLTLRRRKDEDFPVWLSDARTGKPGIGFSATDAAHLGFTQALGDAKEASFRLVRVVDAKEKGDG